MTRNILVLFYLPTARLKPTTAELMYAFKRHSDANCFYVNLFAWSVPPLLRLVRFDLIIFEASFMDRRRSGSSPWQQICKRAAVVKDWDGVRVAMPQDECNYTDRLRDFISEFAIDVVCSVAQPSQWPVIYSGVDFDQTQFVQMLTGYLDPHSLQRINELAQTTGPRTIDIGYRAAYRPQWGRFGLYKALLADLFQAKAQAYGLVADISTVHDTFLVGDDWPRFLLNCKYTLGVESGGSLLDRDGSMTINIRHYLEAHPDASFDEVEAACFPGLDGGVDLRALAPRHFEACATRTCQVLIEGEYNGVLLPWSHYIPLKADFSNIEEVMHVIKEDKMRPLIVEAAYRDIVESGRYTYARYVNDVLDHALCGRPPVPYTPGQIAVVKVMLMLVNGMEEVAWLFLRLRDLALRIAPRRLLDIARRIKNRNYRE